MALDDYEQMCSTDNLKRAYRWVQSNPDASYKSYFRDAYTAYASSSDGNLRRLRRHLLHHAHEPDHASKVYLPKPSGILRPYTLLTVTDQIVYQACASVIAEKLRARVRKRYLRSTFGHLYAGKASQFFYLKWQTGYRAYSKAITDHVNRGFVYVANFDLTAFYDSIDHNVLKHFLTELRMDDDLIEFLLNCLATWSSSTWTNLSNAIYHGHGIPQGPLASGLIAEVVLKHIDDRGARSNGTRYLRYVDDIKLLSRKENTLRHRLVALDLASKEIGLFPQSSKINIRKVSDPLQEIKSVSRPPEPAVTPAPNQHKIRKRLLELTRRSAVKDDGSTRFKYLLARTEPHHALNQRLIGVLRHRPAFFSQVTSYFARYKRLPRTAAEAILDYLKNDEIYHAVHGAFLFATLENMGEPTKTRCIDFCRDRLFAPRKGAPPPQPSYRAALLAWVLHNNRLGYVQLERLMTEEIDWWIRKDVLKYVDKNHYGSASYAALLNEVIKSPDSEPARVAALQIVDNNTNVHSPHKDAHEAARLLLYAAGKIRHIGVPASMVGTVLIYVLDTKLAAFDWRALLGEHHRTAEHIAFAVKRNYEADINGCIVTLDSLADLIWECVFLRELPGLSYGRYGAMLKHPTLMAKYPRATAGLHGLHQLRLQSVTAHPRNLKTGAATRRLKHSDFYRVRADVRDAFHEILGTVTV